MAIPSRKNGQNIDSSWFTSLSEALNDNEKSYALADGQAATDLSSQAFDGTAITSVIFDYEVKRSTTIFATGRMALHYLNGTWRVADGGYEGEEHGVTFTVGQTGTTGQLKAATSSGPGTGTLKLKRKSFNA